MRESWLIYRGKRRGLDRTWPSFLSFAFQLDRLYLVHQRYMLAFLGLDGRGFRKRIESATRIRFSSCNLDGTQPADGGNGADNSGC